MTPMFRVARGLRAALLVLPAVLVVAANGPGVAHAKTSSAGSSATTRAALTAPQNVRITQGNSYLVLLAWNPVAGASTYEYTVNGGASFVRIPFNCAYCPLEGQVPPSIFVYVSALPVGTQFRVRAVGRGGSVGPLSAGVLIK